MFCGHHILNWAFTGLFFSTHSCKDVGQNIVYPEVQQNNNINISNWGKFRGSYNVLQMGLGSDCQRDTVSPSIQMYYIFLCYFLSCVFCFKELFISTDLASLLDVCSARTRFSNRGRSDSAYDYYGLDRAGAGTLPASPCQHEKIQNVQQTHRPL